MKVYTYWKCSKCNGIVRGDNRNCPACGNPIEEGTEYLMPNNPIVIEAVNNNAVLIGDNTRQLEKNIDENGITSDIVPEELESDKPNWNCIYCGYQNKAENSTCESCGAGKEEAKTDYFGNKPKMEDYDKVDYNRRTGTEYIDTPVSTVSGGFKPIETTALGGFKPIEEPEDTNKISDKLKSIGNTILDFIRNNGKTLAIAVAAVVSVVFLVWLFMPVTRHATVSGFNWERNIEIEEYKLCHESDWSVPSGGKITSQREEIHHYDSVLDHYETKTKQVSERVFDHYETHYVDSGNGQAEVEKTPVYKTVYHTETYEEPVYKQVPVYRTKYDYDIGRWKHLRDLTTEGYDKENVYWPSTDVPTSVSFPSYGDERQGSKSETYNIVVIDEEGDTQNVSSTYSRWIETNVGDEIYYKTFRFSHTPITKIS